MTPDTLRFINSMFAAPTTTSEYVERAKIIRVTGYQAVKRWLAAGLLFEAGAVKQGRGAPAMRYCSDQRTARLAQVEAEVEKPDEAASLGCALGEIRCPRCAQLEVALLKLGFKRVDALAAEE